MTHKDTIYHRITQDIINALQAGKLPPWAQPWTSGNQKNLISNLPYRGINQLALQAAAMQHGFQSAYWLTFKQAQERGGAVRKGAKSAIVVKWLWLTEQDENGQPKPHGKTWAGTRYFNVFNLDQVDGIAQPPEHTAPQPIAACETLIAHMPQRPTILHTNPTRAFYTPGRDEINIPIIRHFNAPEGYYATLFHELGHATGHTTRLARSGIMNVHQFGSSTYSREELCAESCAALLCGVARITTAQLIENSASYIQNWLRVLQDDRNLLVSGIQAGQHAADFILGEPHAE